MADGEDRPSPGHSGRLGYGNPPEQHRFKKGVSGNPRGRPRKTGPTRPVGASHTRLEDILLAEALRPIQIRENEKVIEIPMIQAVIRSMGVAAVKGSHRSQTTLASMVQAVQAKRSEDLKALFVSAIEYKDWWQREFDDCDRRGIPRPEPVPHPQEVILSSNSLDVTFNGPSSPDDKAHWDQMLGRRKEALQEVARYRRLLKRPSRYSKFYMDELAHEQHIADVIGGIIPDEATRRQPGFDLRKWRAEKGVLAKLDEKYGRGRRRKQRPR